MKVLIGSGLSFIAELGTFIAGLVAMERERHHRIRLRGPHPAEGALGLRESSHPYSCPHVSVGVPNR